MDNFKLNDMSLSEQAKIQIQKYIATMDFNESNKLPREERLAEIIGVSRITIRKALDDLAADGSVFRRQGKGTFVNVDSLNIKVKFNPAREFSYMIKESGYEPSVKLLGIRMADWDARIGTLLQLEEPHALATLSKLFYADGKLCAYCRDYFRPELVGGVAGFAKFPDYAYSAFDYIYHMSGEMVEWDKVAFDIILGKDIPDFGKHVSLDEFGATPYLRLMGVNYNSENKPLLYVEEYIDTSMIKFNMIRQRNVQYS